MGEGEGGVPASASRAAVMAVAGAVCRHQGRGHIVLTSTSPSPALGPS
jgi:hypothetical protein